MCCQGIVCSSDCRRVGSGRTEETVQGVDHGQAGIAASSAASESSRLGAAGMEASGEDSLPSLHFQRPWRTASLGEPIPEAVLGPSCSVGSVVCSALSLKSAD